MPYHANVLCWLLSRDWTNDFSIAFFPCLSLIRPMCDCAHAHTSTVLAKWFCCILMRCLTLRITIAMLSFSQKKNEKKNETHANKHRVLNSTCITYVNFLIGLLRCKAVRMSNFSVTKILCWLYNDTWLIDMVGTLTVLHMHIQNLIRQNF